MIEEVYDMMLDMGQMDVDNNASQDQLISMGLLVHTT